MQNHNDALIYHITHIRNLHGIIKSGGILSDSEVLRLNSNPTIIGQQDIKDSRLNKRVPLPPGGVVADYTPFYFAPRSPMLFKISKGGVPNYQEGERAVVYLVSRISEVSRHVSWLFTNGNAASNVTNFFDNTNNLCYVDWNVMNAYYWNNSEDDPDRMRRRMAEFLAYKVAPWDCIIGVCTKDDAMLELVREIINKSGTSHKPKLAVRPQWYYEV